MTPEQIRKQIIDDIHYALYSNKDFVELSHTEQSEVLAKAFKLTILDKLLDIAEEKHKEFIYQPTAELQDMAREIWNKEKWSRYFGGDFAALLFVQHISVNQVSKQEFEHYRNTADFIENQTLFFNNYSIFWKHVKEWLFTNPSIDRESFML